MNFAMATLGLKEMGKFLWEGREKSLPRWLSQFSFAKVAIAEFFWKMQRKTWYSILRVDAMPLSLKNLLLKEYLIIHNWIFPTYCPELPIWPKIENTVKSDR